MKVLASNYPAEYGRSSGATVNFVTKSGTKDFHGLFSYFKRHEQFNANDFFNNRLSRSKARYRYNTWNYNIGGPIPIGKINRNRDKLFFFWSQEFWPLTVPTAIAQLTVPTLAERRGDFTQSLDLNGRVIPVRDPTTQQVYPGNVVPASRLDASGLFALSSSQIHFTDRGISGGRYNYVFQSENQTPIRMENARIDYNIRQNHSLAFTIASYVDQQTGAVGILTSGATNWPQMKKTYRLHGQATSSATPACSRLHSSTKPASAGRAVQKATAPTTRRSPATSVPPSASSPARSTPPATPSASFPTPPSEGSPTPPTSLWRAASPSTRSCTPSTSPTTSPRSRAATHSRPALWSNATTRAH
ncbi:MAG: hypothetical protein IPJ98_28465 [Bryobacterales bacterium]|nr:hypothetical protein [Bryobacterales bacterium]